MNQEKTLLIGSFARTQLLNGQWVAGEVVESSIDGPILIKSRSNGSWIFHPGSVEYDNLIRENWECSCSCHYGGYEAGQFCKQPCEECECE